MKNLKQIASEIAKREGKKSQARIGDIREILGILSDLVSQHWIGPNDFLIIFHDNGNKRAKRRKK